MLDRPTIIKAFSLVDDWLAAHNQSAEIFLVGGAVMCLVHQSRPSTKDVDGWFSEPQLVRQAARSVASELDLPEDWLNDAAKAFVPKAAGYETWQKLSHLTVSNVDTETLLAMKCAAARTNEDRGDIEILAKKLGLASSAEVLAIVERYFPASQLPIRTQLLLEEMFA